MTNRCKEREPRGRLLLLLLGAMLASTLACSPKPKPRPPDTSMGTPPMAEPETRAYRACKADSDCVYAQNGCCDCVNGGEAIAVNRDKVGEFKAKFDCSEASCTAKMYMEGCDSGVASCKLGLCQYALKK
jgi:hypothetical protein